MHKPEKVLESEDCKILWDFLIPIDKTIEHNKPDITVIDKKRKDAYWQITHAYLAIVLKEKKEENAQIIVSWSMKFEEFAKWEK